jgi:hypothetical protein
VNGNTSTKPFGPYDYNEYSESDNGGSVYFDGNDDLTATLSSEIGTGDFSISGWYYTGATPTSSHRRIFTIGGNNNANGMSFLHQTSGVLRLRLPANAIDTHSYSYNAGQWVYFCIKRSSGTLTLHINGEQEYSGLDSTNLSNRNLCVGNDTIVLTSIYGIEGNLADFKISTSSIEDGSVPTSVVSSSGSILHLKGTDAHVLDKSQGSNLKLVGNTAASTTQAKFSNTASVYFDGAGDHIEIDGPFDLGTQPWTWETWIYTADTTYTLVNIGQSTTTGTSIEKAGNNLYIYDLAANTFYSVSSIPADNTWTHLAFCRQSNGNHDFYKDGIRVSNYTSWNSKDWGSLAKLKIGEYWTTNQSDFNGYFQDMRLTVGKSRYTAADESSNIPSTPLKG